MSPCTGIDLTPLLSTGTGVHGSLWEKKIKIQGQFPFWMESQDCISRAGRLLSIYSCPWWRTPIQWEAVYHRQGNISNVNVELKKDSSNIGIHILYSRLKLFCCICLKKHKVLIFQALNCCTTNTTWITQSDDNLMLFLLNWWICISHLWPTTYFLTYFTVPKMPILQLCCRMLS